MTLETEAFAEMVQQRPTVPRVDVELQHEIEQFLYHEAHLLDEREFQDWLELFTDDIHYWMPTRYNRLRREMDTEFSAPDECAFFDEDKDSLSRRITRLETGMAWAEDPPSRTRHLFTNIRVVPTEAADEFEVHANYLLYRTRLEHDVEFFVGARSDVLRRVDDGVGWQIARRKVILDQATLNAKNLSMFF
ncbi:MAG TPA: 3-phenylpropionate/cinnamic acid dioxygenase subunit beta [Acidimicrobiia bacterium]|jgi:3-phenylpropionate/cinnamic acid dioxygenase small subunit